VGIAAGEDDNEKEKEEEERQETTLCSRITRRRLGHRREDEGEEGFRFSPGGVGGGEEVDKDCKYSSPCLPPYFLKCAASLYDSSSSFCLPLPSQDYMPMQPCATYT
jgi:hypothetical protein